MNVYFKRLFDGVRLPERSTEGAAGYDLYAYAISETGRANRIVLPPRAVRHVRCGFAMELPPNLWGGVHSRSGLAREKAIFVANAPGVIDSDYRGEVGVLLYNGGHESQWLEHGDRIAQLIFHNVLYPSFEIVEDLSETKRGVKGYGSTGR
jgi:dUTP pyrophosphatase